MKKTQEESMYKAAETIDTFLNDEDGEILAAMAAYRSNIHTYIGHDKIFELLKTIIDESNIVTFFSPRARRELSPQNTRIHLRVDDIAAWTKYPNIANIAGSLCNVNSGLEMSLLTTPGGVGIDRFKSTIIFEEICKKLSDTINLMLQERWAKSKNLLLKIGLSEKDAKLLVSSLFSIRVVDEPSVKSIDRMCVLTLMCL